MHLVSGSVGIVTPVFEALARAIGAGVVVGGFAGATGGVVFNWSRRQVEGHAMRDGYFGAVLAVFGLLVDLCIVYAA
jgi:hypothetical protein